MELDDWTLRKAKGQATVIVVSLYWYFYVVYKWAWPIYENGYENQSEGFAERIF